MTAGGSRAAAGKPIADAKIGGLDVSGGFTTHRTLDQVRGAALANAVDLCCREMAPAEQDPAGVAIAVARRFEAYLTGEEAN
jgi:hypothetical protein